MINRIASKLKKGFTLVEMLVAVLLLTTAIAGPLTIASRGLTASIIAQDQITAFNLAQDAVEYVRFVRDSNRLGGYGWLDGLNGVQNGVTTINGAQCVSNNGGSACYMDSIKSVLDICNSNSCTTALRYDSTRGYFCIFPKTCSGSPAPLVTPQQFKRTVRILSPLNGNANEAQLTVTVTWVDQANITRSVQVQEYLYNWQ